MEDLRAGFGGGKRDRTADLLHAMQALSQLSYTPNRAKDYSEARQIMQKINTRASPDGAQRAMVLQAQTPAHVGNRLPEDVVRERNPVRIHLGGATHPDSGEIMARQ